MIRKLITITICIAVLICNIAVNTFADEDILSLYNEELADIYKTDTLTIYPNEIFIIDDKAKELSLNYKYLNRSKGDLARYEDYFNNSLDGNYIVYGEEFGDYRIRPNTLTYDISKRGKKEIRYLGYSIDGSKFDNPAFPWDGMNSTGIKDRKLIKKPWMDEALRLKYNLNPRGSDYNNLFINGESIYDIEKNIEYGLFAKYVYLRANDTVIGGKDDWLLYYGMAYSDAIKDENLASLINGMGVIKNIGVVKPQAVQEAKNGWLDYIYILSLPTRTTWGTGWLFIDNSYITVLIAPDNLVNLIVPTEGQPNPEETISESVEISGDISLTQKRITKAFNLNDIGGRPTFNFNYESAGRHYGYHGEENSKGEPKKSYDNRSDAVDSDYECNVEVRNAATATAIGTLGRFKWELSNSSKSGRASWSGGSESVQPNVNFVAQRAQDLPTIAAYKFNGTNPLSDLGVKVGNTPQNNRNTTGGYVDNVSITMGYANGDYRTSFECDCGDSKRQSWTMPGLQTRTASLAVQSYIGRENSGNATTNFQPTSFKNNNVTFSNGNNGKVTGYAVNNSKLIKFYPYIEMLYQIPNGMEGKVNVLAQHESSIKPVDYVDIGWFNSNQSNSLTINSTQWSTHARAVSQ